MTILYFYLLISLIVAITNIKACAKEETYLLSVPVGDLEFYQRKNKIVNPVTVIFFPSLAFQLAYLFVVRIINAFIN